jgi:hypothetical protein
MQTQKELECTVSQTLRLIQMPSFMPIHTTSHFLIETHSNNEEFNRHTHTHTMIASDKQDKCVNIQKC